MPVNTNKKASVHSTRTHRPKSGTQNKLMNCSMLGRQDVESPRDQDASLPHFNKRIEAHRAPRQFETMMTVTNPRKPPTFGV